MDENSRQNPYTGGGFIIAIHSIDGSITEITFNGGWLMAASSEYEKRVTFNIENTDGQKLCNDINNIFYNTILQGRCRNETKLLPQLACSL